MMSWRGLSPNEASNNSRGCIQRSQTSKILRERGVSASSRGHCLCRQVLRLQGRPILCRQEIRITCGEACSTLAATWLRRTLGPITLISHWPIPPPSMTGFTVAILGASIAEVRRPRRAVVASK